MSVQVVPSVERCHLHASPVTPPSGSVRVAVSVAPAIKPVSGDTMMVPGSSTLVTATVTEVLLMSPVEVLASTSTV